MNKLLWKLIRLQISPWQMLGFSLANVIGLTVVLFGIQFYQDSMPLFTSNDSFMKEEYIVLTKDVGFSAISGKNTSSFTEKEINELASQPFVEDCAAFTAANFSVIASINSAMAGVGFQTEMFLEALPNKYLDIDLSKWNYKTESNQVPIVIPRNYLNLYNFGFASGRGLPAISESMIGMIPITLYLQGEKGSMIVEGRVVAFSNRINTILVPLDFIKQANDSLSIYRDQNITRLCVDVKNPTDANLGEYIAQHGYRTEGSGGDSGRMAYFLRLICFVVIGIGICICVLAFFVMLLSIFLLLHKNKKKTETLKLIGYNNKVLCIPYYTVIGVVYVLSYFVSVFTLSLLRESYLPHFAALTPDFNLHIGTETYLINLLICLTLCSMAYMIVWRKIKRT